MSATLKVARNRHAKWCFTVNNFSPEDEMVCPRLFQEKRVVYYVVGKEVSTTGTPHLQGYLELNTRSRLTELKRILPRTWHLEPARGSGEDNFAYCTKDNNFVTEGIPIFSLNLMFQAYKRGKRAWSSKESLTPAALSRNAMIKILPLLSVVSEGYRITHCEFPPPYENQSLFTSSSVLQELEKLAMRTNTQDSIITLKSISTVTQRSSSMDTLDKNASSSMIFAEVWPTPIFSDSLIDIPDYEWKSKVPQSSGFLQRSLSPVMFTTPGGGT